VSARLSIFQRAFAGPPRAKGMSLGDIAKEIGCSHSGIDVMLGGQERAPKSDPWRERLRHLGGSEGEDIRPLGLDKNLPLAAVARQLARSPPKRLSR
jgi:hypothetical protein